MLMGYSSKSYNFESLLGNLKIYQPYEQNVALFHKFFTNRQVCTCYIKGFLKSGGFNLYVEKMGCG